MVATQTGKDSKTRFTDRTEDYVKYRPGYPFAMMDFIKTHLSLSEDKTVADIGAGTGISSELFLREGSSVYAVEPNQAMLEKAKHFLAKYPKFTAVNGSAEATTLPDQCADFIVVVQAFHWLNQELAKKEFQRILKPGGKILIIWNSRILEKIPFMQDYEKFVNDFALDYGRVNHRNVDQIQLKNFFGSYEKRNFPSHQDVNFEELLGRLASTSYLPGRNHPRFPEMESAAKDLFHKHQNSGKVRIDYETELYYSKT